MLCECTRGSTHTQNSAVPLAGLMHAFLLFTDFLKWRGFLSFLASVFSVHQFQAKGKIEDPADIHASLNDDNEARNLDGAFKREGGDSRFL